MKSGEERGTTDGWRKRNPESNEEHARTKWRNTMCTYAQHLSEILRTRNATPQPGVTSEGVNGFALMPCCGLVASSMDRLVSRLSTRLSGLVSREGA